MEIKDFSNLTVLVVGCGSIGKRHIDILKQLRVGKIIACDIHNHRLDLIKSGAVRLGITNIECMVNDAAVFNDNLPMADKVLCDVPCSGLGIVRRKPEIRCKPLDTLKALPPIQSKILDMFAYAS